MNATDSERRVVSGMRPTGALHLGHYHGVLKNWVALQHEFECFFFVADWHALTTHYADPQDIATSTWQTLVDWLAAGIDPGAATLFIQSRVPEHAELALLLGMIAPVSWLERVPTYKEQQTKLNDRDLSTYGFLGYPLLQAADILVYRAGKVPVGADQKTSTSFPSGRTTGMTPVTAMCSVTGCDQVRPPSSERCSATSSSWAPISV